MEAVEFVGKEGEFVLTTIEGSRKFLDGLVANPMDLCTEYALALVEDRIGKAFSNLGRTDRRAYSRKLYATGYSAGCMHC